MIGKISKYDEINGIGYILGYDELTYFYHQNSIVKNEKLKEGDIVSFDYILEKNQNELPYAMNIEKEKYEEENNADYKDIFSRDKRKETDNNNSSQESLTIQKEKKWYEKFKEFINKLFGKN